MRKPHPHRAFTLLELQVTLLLAMIVLAMLFLFTSYFRGNHVRYQQTYEQQRETDRFFAWVDTQIRNSQTIENNSDGLLFKHYDGEEVQLKVNETGASVAALSFFNQEIPVKIAYRANDGRKIRIEVSYPNRAWVFERNYAKRAHLSLSEAYHEP